MFPCHQCGAQLEYEPGTHAQRCRYCGAENVIPASADEIHELDYVDHLNNAERTAETIDVITVKCVTCGAESTKPPNVTAGKCPFCGADIVATGASRKQLKPKALLPFDIDRKTAGNLFRDWIRGLWFAPNELRRRARQDAPVNGMYCPYWTYDCNTTTVYSGMRGDDYWTTESYTAFENGRHVTRTRQVRRTRWSPASGTVFNQFDDVLVVASNSLPREYAHELAPWDMQHLVPYQAGYLAGFGAESYQVDLRGGFELAKAIMASAIHATICADIGGDHQRVTSTASQYDNITFKHILLPIWISAYRYRGKVFRFLVNARTGEVQGERPWSWIKIALAVIALTAVVGIIVFLSAGSR
ncbi:MAG: hypothetical protein SGI88_06435 [Candidatus Hydrogenedentes bacterium]|nr:hypothetical protein [Candidatus Hydrogenedentota bacterium]